MNVVALVGSLRKDAWNMQLAKTVQARYGQQFHLEIADIASIPHYNQDDELHPIQAVVHFKKQIAEADAVLIFTPEFNWSIPGVLKNALDWLSRVDRVMANKPVTVLGVTPVATGTLRAQLELRKILQAPGLNTRLLPPAGNEILISFAADKFADGKLVDVAELEKLDRVIGNFVSFVQSP